MRLLAACGCPPSLVLEGADETAQRESLRRFLHTTISPVAQLCVEELAEALLYGTLKRGYWNHDPFCEGVLEIRDAQIGAGCMRGRGSRSSRFRTRTSLPVGPPNR